MRHMILCVKIHMENLHTKFSISKVMLPDYNPENFSNSASSMRS